ncbi:MAG: magnesium/cobalt transporter CorA [Candidatus Melainabacteria bacterium]|nr:magnesium/cobalt transporter CorA [Candidatus Melainabacteria bacterium]
MSKGKRRQKKHRETPRTEPGSSPGSLVLDPSAPPPVVTLIAYSDNTIEEKTITDPAQLPGYLNKTWPVVWVNVDGLGSIETISAIGETFKIHSLALEDVITSHQRSKLEMYGDNYFLISHMMELGEEDLITEQVSIFIGRGFVVTFQDGPLDCFERVRERIRKHLGKIRTVGSDYLAYALLDSVIDCYYPVLETYGERLEILEDEIIEKCNRATIRKVHNIKRELLVMRRAIWPLRDAISNLMRDSSDLFTPDTMIFMRDCHDHAVQICDFIETFRELGSDLMDVYLSSASNKLGESMRLLTIITTICAPPTVVAGIYGMNFNTERSPFNMPELNWFYGYPFALALMTVLVIWVVVLLRSQGWLGNNSHAHTGRPGN